MTASDRPKVEHAFRCLKTVDLKVRPIRHGLADRVRAHVFLCMLAYYVEWQMRAKLAPIVFADHEREEAEAQRESIVRPAPRSEADTAKDTTKRTDSDLPVHSFQTLLSDLATLAKNLIRIGSQDCEFHQLTTPTTLQEKDRTDVLNAAGKLACGLQQFMAGARKFNLSELARDDLMAANKETAEASGIPYMLEAQDESAKSVLTA
ncbi:MAG: hypothetical protein ACQESR_02065 [Planctomycetota bacterium]